MSFFTADELGGLGLCGFGADVRISKKASLYGTARILLGSHVRIDDFCVLSAGDGGIEIGDYVHIAVYCSLIGAGKITLSDFSGLSSKVSVYSSNDDYSGEHMTNPTVPERFTGVSHQDVFIGRHAIVGTGSVILPGVRIEEGAAVGALSMVNKDCSSFGIFHGNPARRIAERSRHLLYLEQQFRGEEAL